MKASYCAILLALPCAAGLAGCSTPPGDTLILQTLFLSDPTVFEEDQDGDGKIDHRFIDYGSDGKIDSCQVDRDEDGKPEETWFDGDKDGKFDSVVFDDDEDGKADRGLAGSGKDGFFTRKWTDKNDNGRIDDGETEPVRQPIEGAPKRQAD